MIACITHPPGSVLREALEHLNMTVSGLAKHLDVSRITLSRVINGNAGISPAMSSSWRRRSAFAGPVGSNAEQPRLLAGVAAGQGWTRVKRLKWKA